MKPEAGKRIMEDVQRDRGKLTSSDLQVHLLVMSSSKEGELLLPTPQEILSLNLV